MLRDSFEQSKNINQLLVPHIKAGLIKPVKDFIVEFKKYNRQDAGYIIGNSPTVNSISRKQWHEIDRFPTIAFSSFVLYENYIPDILFTEITDFYNSFSGKSVLKRLNKVPVVILKDCFGSDGATEAVLEAVGKAESTRFFFTEDVFCTGITANTVLNNYKRFFERYRKGYEPLDFLVRKKASLSMALFFFLVCGIKNIKFLACELDDNNYFHGETPLEGCHATEKRMAGSICISEVIKAQVEAYNLVNCHNKAKLFANGGKLVRSGVAEEYSL